MDAVPIPWLSFSAATGGWTLAGFAVFCVVMGWLIPRWVFRLLLRRIDVLEAENKLLLEQNSMLLRNGLPLTNAVLTGLREAADVVKEDST